MIHERVDAHEADQNHLRNTEEAYFQLAKLNSWWRVNCAPKGTFESLRTPEDIWEEVHGLVSRTLNS